MTTSSHIPGLLSRANADETTLTASEENRIYDLLFERRNPLTSVEKELKASFDDDLTPISNKAKAGLAYAKTLIAEGVRSELENVDYNRQPDEQRAADFFFSPENRALAASLIEQGVNSYKTASKRAYSLRSPSHKSPTSTSKGDCMAEESAFSIIQNCSFKKRCSEKWSDMKVIDDQVRWCDVCREAVYRVSTIPELVEQVRQGHCVSVDVPQGSDNLLGFIDDIPF